MMHWTLHKHLESRGHHTSKVSWCPALTCLQLANFWHLLLTSRHLPRSVVQLHGTTRPQITQATEQQKKQEKRSKALEVTTPRRFNRF